MTRHRLEAADVFREHEWQFFKKYGKSLSPDQRRAFRAIVSCRTAALGGHVERCDACGREQISYNSCRNRHCPKCQSLKGAKWTEARVGELLPIPYFHVVFTLPQEIGPLALQNQRVVYGILFRAAAETLQELAADPKHLGAEIGVLSVLHTWGQTLVHHPHLHCIVTGGGLSSDGQRWIGCKRSRKGKRFFVPVKILSRVFRGKFIALLKRAYRTGKLKCLGKIANWTNPEDFKRMLDRSVRNDWIVYCKRPFESATPVLKYLARYTHRVAISNSRLLDRDDAGVRFTWKDYADSGKQKVMQLEGPEFIRRFLLHIVPRGFMRIRYHGFLANRFRKQNLDRCRKLLGTNRPEIVTVEDSPKVEITEEGDPSTHSCHHCGKGKLTVVYRIPREGHRTVLGVLHSRSPPE